MTIEAIREKILHDDEFVLEEIKRIQYCFGLKSEIRYGLERTADDFTESVAEHVYGMHVIVDYFLPLEDPEQTLEVQKIRHMVTWHDMDELETGDTISWKKTESDVAAEATAWEAVIPHLPVHTQDNIAAIVGEYEARASAEAKFVKAIDKTEPIFHLYQPKGKEWSKSIGLTRYNADRVKQPFVEDFPYMKRFINVAHDVMEAEGFFTA